MRNQIVFPPAPGSQTRGKIRAGWLRPFLFGACVWFGFFLRGETTVAEVREAGRAATVMVRSSNRVGSGFLVHTDGETAYVVTHRHVLRRERGALTPRAEVVFNKAFPEERVLPARVAGIDVENDIAVLRVVSSDGFPKPLELNQTASLEEGMRVWSFGFPGRPGTEPSEDQAQASVFPGRVTDVRKAESGELLGFGIETPLTPHQTGGPVLNAEGSLVGLVVAPAGDTGEGLGIPAEAIRAFGEGRFRDSSWTFFKRENNTHAVRFRLYFLDPMQNIREVFVRVVSPDPEEAEHTGETEPLRLTPSPPPSSFLTGELDLPETLPGLGEFFVEIRVRHGDGEQERFSARRVRLQAPAVEPSVRQTSATPNRVSLEEAANGFAFNPETGELAAISERDNRLRVYSRGYLAGEREEDGVKRVELPRKPIALHFKRFGDQSMYLLVCEGDSHVYVFDAETLERTARIATGSATLSQVSSSLCPDDPFVYYAHGRGHDSALGRIHLGTLAHEEKIVSASVMDFAVSARGNLIYTRGPWSASGLRVWVKSTNSEAPEFTQAFHQSVNTPPYVPDKYEQRVATGNTLRSADLQRQLERVEFDVKSFFPGRPLIAGIHEDRFRVASLNTYQTLGEVTLDPTLAARYHREERIALPGVNTHADFKRITYQKPVFPDPTGERFLLCVGDQVLFIPLADLELPDEPLLVLDIIGPTLLQTHRTYEWPLAPVRAETGVRFNHLPSFARHEDGKLLASPGVRDVGTYNVEVVLYEGDFEFSQPFVLQVEQPHVALGFHPSRVASDSTGRFAVASRVDEHQETEIVLADMDRHTLMDRTRVRFPVTNVAFTPTQVILAPSDGAYLHVLGLEDFSVSRRIFLDHPPNGIQVAGNHLIVQPQRAGALLFSLPDLEVKGPVGSPDSRGLSVERVGQNWMVNGILYPEDFSKPLRLFTTPVFPLLDLSTNQLHTRPVQIPVPSRWGRRLTSQRSLSAQETLLDNSGRSVARVTGTQPALLDDQPLVFSLQGASPRGRELLALVSDLDTGKILDSILLGMLSGNWDRIRSTTAGSHAIVAFNQNLMRLDLSLEPQPPDPLRYVPGDAPFLWFAGDTRIHPRVRGGTPPYRFELMGEWDGLTLDPDTGALEFQFEGLKSIALQRIQNEYLDRYRSRLRNNNSPEQSLEFLRVRLETQIRDQRQVLQSTLGREPHGLALPLFVTVIVKDRQQQQLTLPYLPVLELQPDDILAPARELAEAARPQTPVDPMPEPGGEIPRSTQELEQRVEELERQIEVLLRLLQSRLAE